MALDVRAWSFFTWLVASCMYLGGYATPYQALGNRLNVQIAFGGDVLPGGSRIGLWRNIPDEWRTTMTGVQAILSVSLACTLTTLVAYIFMFKVPKSNIWIIIVGFVAQLLAGVLALIAIGVFNHSADHVAHGEGFWMVTSAGGLYIVNALVLLFMPWMEHQIPKWMMAEEVPLTTQDVELTTQEVELSTQA